MAHCGSCGLQGQPSACCRKQSQVWCSLRILQLPRRKGSSVAAERGTIFRRGLDDGAAFWRQDPRASGVLRGVWERL